MRQAYVVSVFGICPKHGEWMSLNLTMAHSQGEALATGVQHGSSAHAECRSVKKRLRYQVRKMLPDRRLVRLRPEYHPRW